MIPWLHWWFVATDSTGKPKWTKNTFDESEPWDMENPPMKEDNSNWFNLSSGDKVLFIGEA